MENWTLPTNHAWSCWPSPATRGYDCATSRPPWALSSAAPPPSSPTSPRPATRPSREKAAATATRSRPASRCPGRPAERTPHHGDSEQVIVAERPQGSFTRQLSLAEGVDPENLTADDADGVLHLIIPVSPKTWARRVEITHAPGGSRTI